MNALVLSRRWLVLAVGWAVTIVVGYIGWRQQGSAAGVSRSVLETAYATLVLFTVNFPLGTEHVGPALQFARFAAPVVTAGTVVQAAAVLFRRQIELARLGRARGHAVVCGLGEKGRRLAMALADSQQRVAAIEHDPAAPGVATARARGITVVDGDARDEDSLRAAGVPRAGLVVVTMGDDASAMDVAAAARQLMQPGTRLAVHLTDPRLCGLLRGESLRSAGTGPRLELFNIVIAGARQWLAAHAPFPADVTDAMVMVVGLGPLGQALTVSLVQRWVAGDSAAPLRLVLVDPAASSHWQALAVRSPGVGAHATAECLDVDLDAADPGSASRLETLLADERLTSVHVALDNDASAMSAAIRIHHGLRGRAVPVVVRTGRQGGLSAILRRDDGTAAFAGLYPFSLVDRTCTIDTLDGGPIEALARALHDDYLRRGGHGAFAVPWDDLPDEAKDSNREAADDVYGGLKKVGCDLIPADEWEESDDLLSAAEVDVLACREHERWRSEREADGWTHGAKRDDVAKHNPLLLPWAELPEEARQLGRSRAAHLPALLARAGFHVVRAPSA